jgi:hypothetical protein
VTKNSVELAAPDFFTHPKWDVTLGPEVGEVATLAGLAPYPEQQVLLDEVFALDRNNPNRSASFEAAAVVTRQQLKTGLLKQLALGWLFVMPQPLVIWSAHEFGTAQEAFRDMQGLLASSPDLDRRIMKIRTAAGSEAIEMRDGSRLRFKARTSGGGRGLTGSKVILDEAFALDASQMGALLPTLIAVPDPQVIYASSAGLAKSLVLRGVRDRGRKGADRMTYAEWLAEFRDCADKTCDHAVGTDGCALDDKDLWRKACIISARKDRDEMQAIANLRMALPPAEFMRECLGWWDEPTGEAVVSAATWETCEDPVSTAVRDYRFALDVSPARSWAAISVAGYRADGLPHLEVTSRKGLIDHRPGVNWVVERAVELRDAQPGFALTIVGGSAAEALVPALTLAGVPLEFVKSADVPAACGLFYDLATSGRVRHIGQTELSDALTGARKNVEDGEGAWRWGRRKSAADITPLYAATVALWALTNSSPPAEPSIHFL